MSSLEMNKIGAAVLTAGVIAMTAGFIAEQLFHKAPLAEHAFMVEGVGETQTASVAETPSLDPVTPLLAAADLAAGEKAFKKCSACHTVDKGGKDKVGPNLWGVVMAAHASREFGYSDVMSDMSGETWSYEALNEFLASPKKYAPGTKMSFGGLKKVQDRANIIAYLRNQSDNPAPLPE
ncbi:cytochrome c family protein [Pelagibius sp. Alg239-R121]|uniref:c-type cytochrome n=1 Tax=Pelagibius sp. Alg239-R121 TaxID=2993448 RepID=UPI0024A670EA|nr:cytochrome c family protein [Pelagibius sp. Alg239-R121]